MAPQQPQVHLQVHSVVLNHKYQDHDRDNVESHVTKDGHFVQFNGVANEKDSRQTTGGRNGEHVEHIAANDGARANVILRKEDAHSRGEYFRARGTKGNENGANKVG